MLTEEVLEQLVGDDGENHGAILGRVYLNKVNLLQIYHEFISLFE